MNKFCVLLIGIISVTISSCEQSDETLIKKMIKTFKTESINKNEIDWENFEIEVFKSLKISEDSAIITALTLNHNPHTFFLVVKSY